MYTCRNNLIAALEGRYYNGRVLWIISSSSHYVVVLCDASNLDWKLFTLDCLKLMVLKGVRCQLEQTSGEFTLGLGHLLPNAFGSFGQWNTQVVPCLAKNWHKTLINIDFRGLEPFGSGACQRGANWGGQKWGRHNPSAFPQT